MRPWRKLHSNIVNSDRLAEVSDSAAALFFLLICRQDDVGVYPNSKVHLPTRRARPPKVTRTP